MCPAGAFALVTTGLAGNFEAIGLFAVLWLADTGKAGLPLG